MLSDAASSKVDSHTLQVQFSSEPTQYDPLFMEDGPSLRIASNVVATPLEYDGKGVLRNGLAEEVTPSQDRKRWVVRFRKNLKWSDGVSFHASQFVAAMNRMNREKVRPALSVLFPKFDFSQTKVLDERTVQIVLMQPDSQLKNLLALPPFAPIRDDFLTIFSKRNPIVPTLAAYQVIEYRRESHLLLKKNPLFYEADLVGIPQVRIRFVKDDSLMHSLLQSGEVDVLCKVPPLQLDQIKKHASVVDVPVEAVTYFGFNTNKPPFQNVQNRRAIYAAIAPHRSELAKLLKTGELAATAFLPSVSSTNRNPLSSAWKELDSSLSAASVESVPFQMQTDGGSRNEIMLQFVQSLIQKKLNWKMKIDAMEWKAHYSRLKIAPDEMFRFGWQNPVSDPYLTYQVLMSDSPNNFTGWKNGEYDRLVQELRQESKPTQRQKILFKLEKIIATDVPVVPVLHQVLRYAYSKRVDGFRANPFGVILFRELRIAKP
jgi:ABC-type transport system substrate-binding protein